MVEGRAVFEGVSILERRGELPGEVSAVACDSRAVNPGDLFVALRGSAFDGHAFVEEARRQGACAAVVEEWRDSPLPQFRVRDSLAALPRISANVYERPAQHLHLTGITGSNGKTTSAYLFESLWKTAQEPVAVLSTIECRYAGKTFEAENTTPLSHVLQKHLKQIADAYIHRVVMEVSSHGLALHRVDEVEFDTAIFTNLTQDHLDFHHSMHGYRDAKKRLFTRHLKGNGAAVLNIDDEAGERFSQELLGRTIITYGIDTPADVMAQEIKQDIGFTEFLLVLGGDEIPARTRLIGLHNVYNILGVAAAAWSQGMPLDLIQQGIEAMAPAPGRLETVPNGLGVQVVVDYCHTPDALEKCIAALRRLPHKRFITLFGCGGDRDAQKRPIMGGIAERNSDAVIVTSDNPRTEDPAGIINMILSGFDAPETADVIPDRKQAIQQGINRLQEGDIFLIAGKGHETYQIIGREKHSFDDRAVASDELRKKESALRKKEKESTALSA